jgi:hypothetical protein
MSANASSMSALRCSSMKSGVDCMICRELNVGFAGTYTLNYVSDAQV